MDRQLNMGFGGPVGFRYESLYPLLDRVCKDSEDEWWATFRDFQTMESAAMEEAHRK